MRIRMDIIEVRKRLNSQYEKVLSTINPNLASVSDLLDNKEAAVKELILLGQEIKNFKEQVANHKELRHGNVLGALDEADVLIAEGKGDMAKLQRTLEKLKNESDLNEFQSDFGAFRARQELLIRFLEAEVHQV